MNHVPPIPSRPWIASTRPDGRGMPPVIASPAPGGDGPAAVRDWRRRILAVWTAHGHAEAQLRELAAADAMPLDPQQ